MSSNIITTGSDPPGTNYPVSANAITLPIFSIIFIILLIVPFRLLYRVSNIAACSLVIINIISLIFVAMNAIIWPTDNLSNRWSGHIVCDIQVLVRQALYTAMASTTCCITKFLARAVDTDNACLHETAAMKRRKVIKDCLFCFTIPVLQVALHYVIQLNRYTVMTIYGCVDATDLSWPSIVIVHIWPPIFACLNVYFAVLVICRLRRHRTNFTSTLSSSNSGLSPRRFLKLFSMSVVLLVIYFPVVIYYFYLNVSWPLQAYSWSRIHDPLFWHLIVFWRIADGPSGMQYDAWNWVAFALMIFLFWGCNSEGGEIYRRGLVKLGLARWWPRLRMTLQERRVEKMEREGRTGMSTMGSWTGKFDLISKTMHYFENKEAQSRKQSVATATTLNDGDMTRTSTRKFSHATQPDTNIHPSTHSGYNSRTATAYSPSTHKPSIATASINENDISYSSSAPTCADPDVITAIPRTLSPETIYSHIPHIEHSGAEEITIPAPTSAPVSRKGIFGVFRTHVNPLPLGAFLARGKGSDFNSSSAFTGRHGDSHSRSGDKTKIHTSSNEKQVPVSHFSDDNMNTATTLTTQIWSANNTHRSSDAGLLVSGECEGESVVDDHGNGNGAMDIDEEKYDQEDILTSPRPGTRAYRERERREMIAEREERKRDREGLNVKRTFEVVEERESVSSGCAEGS
ncbi:hypothetical protein SBOR_8835 [Sclerotinia borealis F-4128]|uniref:Uncharacterized protein n=1 Tax=Sclerotinia borealis (strain F-4128) TaxID=1432307 RepID=W9C1Y5_SCLBF|nr:hypothetical protein SBOR_8835 [Sclerotinia borealis F-4128]